MHVRVISHRGFGLSIQAGFFFHFPFSSCHFSFVIAAAAQLLR
jgi:hypothetical protein